ncbi:MAG TPA: hypothetical protein VK790_06435 [Solirubrobacteraceae bacterium]|jgi:hypothetical protein|nr:hypothetical protein [Solirubrobacteraceae bacterium]
MDTLPTNDTDAIAVLVKRLARPHPSGGTVIERPVILAEGTRSTAILAWIADHGGAPDSTLPSARSKGLHSPSPDASVRRAVAPARRYILPAQAFN